INGSYNVPIGRSRSPLMTCDRPRADSTENKFISAMPSSMCWPFGENSQLKVDGMRSLLKVSAKASRANRPRRLTQGPRLVDTVTSGEAVMMGAAAEFVKQRTEAKLGRHSRLNRDRETLRHSDLLRLHIAVSGARKRHAIE